MEITGILYKKLPEIQINEKFKKKDFVIEYAENPEYPQHLCFSLNNDKISFLDKIKVGDSVNIKFNLVGKTWTSPKGEEKYFTLLNAYKIEKI